MKTLAVAVLFVFLLIVKTWADGPVPAAAKAKEVDIPAQWGGSSDDPKTTNLANFAPENGVIADAESWEKLWKAWNSTDKLPVVKFDKELVLVAAAQGGGNRITNARVFLTADGDLQFNCMKTQMAGPGFVYKILKVSREGVKTVNGKEFPKAAGVVKGIKFTLSADKTDLKITPQERAATAADASDYAVEQTTLTFSFTNESDHAIKLDLYDFVWSKLSLEVTGPDAKSVRIDDKRAVIERDMMAPREKDYPVIEPGKSFKYTYEPKFPGRIGGINYTVLKPGKFRIKAVYTRLDDPVRRKETPVENSPWTDSISSNEIVLNYIVPSELPGEQPSK